MKTLGVPKGSQAFVRKFLNNKFDKIDNAIALAVSINDGRMSQNIIRVAALKCRVTHLIRLI